MGIINNVWFDLTIVNAILAFGNVYFGHFEEYTPRWKKFLKVVLLNLGTFVLHTTWGQVFSLCVIGVLIAAVAIIHMIVLPIKGINGWTGEPKEKYYRLRKWDKHLRSNG